MWAYRSISKRSVVVAMLGLAMLQTGCQRQPPAAQQNAPSAPQPAAAAQPAAADAASSGALQDVIENTPSYVVGISYPAGLEAQPELVALIRGYADAARSELKQAVADLGNARPTAPYELSLSFNKVLETPQLLVIAADGSSYTGGKYGSPLLARFVWLVQSRRQLTSAELIPTPQGRELLSRYVAARLHESAEQRVQADHLTPQQRTELLESVDGMISSATTVAADKFCQFQPLLDASGKISALRFVFAPYQVGPYADGIQSIDVPAAQLRPVLASQYAELFAP
jgi:hypothetical protein